MASAANPQFELRWGIIGTGLIASWFVSDLLLDPATHRGEHSIKHKVQAIGSSSISKATAFTEKHLSTASYKPKLYDTYGAVYNDPDVDIVYIATPHVLHKKNSLDAIRAGKHVLCEKPIAVNARDAEEIISAAREKGVFLMEGVWTRFFPLVTKVKALLHEEKAIGKISRAFIDFGLDMPLDKQPTGSRLADISLGAGSLLDIGIYTLTWASLILFDALENNKTEPEVVSSLTKTDTGVDELSSVILTHNSTRAQAICTSGYLYKTEPEFARIEGSEGSLVISGRAASKPLSLKLRRKGKEEEVLDFEFEGWGFFYEADAVARDIRAGKLESDIIPLCEALRIMSLMDKIRSQNGLRYPQDE